MIFSKLFHYSFLNYKIVVRLPIFLSVTVNEKNTNTKKLVWEFIGGSFLSYGSCFITWQKGKQKQKRERGKYPAPTEKGRRRGWKCSSEVKCIPNMPEAEGLSPAPYTQKVKEPKKHNQFLLRSNLEEQLSIKLKPKIENKPPQSFRSTHYV